LQAGWPQFSTAYAIHRGPVDFSLPTPDVDAALNGLNGIRVRFRRADFGGPHQVGFELQLSDFSPTAVS
jgi:hypothetical protein